MSAKVPLRSSRSRAPAAPRRPGALDPAGLLLAAALLSLGGISGAGGFEVLDGTWPGGIVPFRVNPNFPDRELSGSPAEQIELLRCGADAWHDQSRADFRFDYEGTTSVRRISDRDRVNAIFWADADGGDALAATLFTSQGGVAVSCDVIYFASTDGSSNAWSGPGEPGSGTVDIQGVASHELGHALGLGHTEVVTATMYASLRSRGLPLRTLADDDRAGVEFLYGLRTVESPAVEVTSASPALGPSEGGNEVVLEGLNFTYDSETRVLVDGVAVDRGDWAVESCGRLRIASMPPHDAGSVSIQILNSVGAGTLADAYLYEGEPISAFFLRGDSNGDGKVDASDPIFLLDHLFRGASPGPCDDAADTNDDGTIDLSDAVTALLLLFRPEVSSLPPPFPEAGPDPTEDSLGCRP